jgi:uracil-DNA glycosylase
MSAIDELLREAAAALRFQGELGLTGLDVTIRAKTESRSPSPENRQPRTESREPKTEHRPPKPDSAAPTPASASLPSAARLIQIREELGDCQRCKLCSKRTNIVYGVGSPVARLMFVGEAPGRDEDLQGEPFVGAAGQLLTKMIGAMGLKRGDVYIANVLKCRPPQNRDPEPDEVEACEPFLREQIRAIKPAVLVALGRHAAHALLRDTTPITRLRGNWREYDGIPLMPTYHPAYLLRNPAEKKPCWEDLQKVMARMAEAGPRA